MIGSYKALGLGEDMQTENRGLVFPMRPTLQGVKLEQVTVKYVVPKNLNHGQHIGELLRSNTVEMSRHIAYRDDFLWKWQPHQEIAMSHIGICYTGKNRIFSFVYHWSGILMFRIICSLEPIPF